MKNRWKRWISGLIAVLLIVTNLPLQAFADMRTAVSEKPVSITTSDGGTVRVEENWEEVYPYGAFLFTNSEAALTEGGDETVISLYRLGGTRGRATAYVVYAPVAAQLTEEVRSFASAAGCGDVEISAEDALPVARYQPLGKDPEPEASEVRILEKAAEGEEAQPGDHMLYLSEDAESWQWYVLLDDRWEMAEGATDKEFLLSGELLEKLDFRCVFSKDGQSFSTDSLKGEKYVRPAEEVLPEMPEDLELNPEKTFTRLEMDPENPYAAGILPLTFADGEWVKEIRVSAPENDQAQPLRFGTFTILEHSGGAVFSPASTVTLRLTDNDEEDPYTIRFEETKVRADRSGETAVVKLRREGGGQDPVTVDYETVDGTAEAGRDYRSVRGTAVFYADVDEVTIEIPLISGGTKSEEPLTFTVALGELKGDAKGLCTLADREAVVSLTNEAGESPKDPEEEADDSREMAAAGNSEEATRGGLPAGVIADAFREGAEDSGGEPITGEQAVVPEDELLRGEIAGLEGMGQGGPLRTYVFGQISFNQGTGGEYWEDEAYVAGRSVNALTGWSGGSASGNGWQIRSDDNASATLNIEHMSQMYSRFHGNFEFKAGLDNGWHFTNGYAYGWAGVRKMTKSGWEWQKTVSSNPKLTTSLFKRNLSWYEGGTLDTSWDMNTDVRSVSLQISKHENKSDDPVYSRITSGYLSRRIFRRKLSLHIHTANDGESGGGSVATAPEGGAAFRESSGVYNSMKPEILVEEHAGGVNGAGQLYVGSRLKITLSSTDSYRPYTGSQLNAAVYVTRSDGSIVNARIEPGSSGVYFVTMLWDGMTEEDLSDSYALNIVMTRTQKLELNLQPSVERKSNRDGSVSDEIDPEKIGDAWDAFWKSGEDSITVGCSETFAKAPHFDGKKISESRLRKTDWKSGDKNPLKILGTLDNLQYINFNRGKEDRILFNGKMYEGNERIYLTVDSLAFPKLSFTYYSQQCLNRPDIMNVSISRVELYLDGDGDGRIAGCYNEETGYFVPDPGTKDTFEMYLDEDGNYDETMFQPVDLGDGRFGQYFAKIYYTMTPRSLDGSGGYAQVLPAFTTSRTDEGNFSKLTDEQQSYRYLLAGKREDGTRTSDNHPMYGAEATAFQFVDVPLGGDRSPLVEVKKDVYEWNPKYVGNLIYPFKDPEPIYIEHSLAGDSYPLANVRFGKSGGVALDEEGRDNLNGYLGSLVADTTIALCVTEQRLTADQLHNDRDSEKNLRPESSALSRRSASPSGAWLTQMDSGNMGSAGFDTKDSGQDYPEFNMNYDLDLPVTNESFQGLATIVTGKNTLNIVISVPIFSRTGKNGNPASNKWFPSTVTDPLGTAADQIGAYADGIKNGGSYDEIIKALERGGYQKAEGGSLSCMKTSVTVIFTVIITLKYDTRDNAWHVQEFAAGAGATLSTKYTVRLAVCPLVYGYVSISAGATITTGGTFLRTVRESERPMISDGMARKLSKGEELPFRTPFVNALIEFSGKILIKTEPVGGEKFNNGYLKSKGGDKLQLQFMKSKSSMYFDESRRARKITIVALEDTTINYLNTIESIKSELVWSGVKVSPKISGEAGVGAGVEGISVEAFIKPVISANFTYGRPKEDGSRKGLAVEDASFSLSLAFRAVLLMTKWEMDAVGVKATYDGKTDQWKASYTLLGKVHDIPSGDRLAGEEASLAHLPAAMDRSQTIYSSQPGTEEAVRIPRAFAGAAAILRAYRPDDPRVPFELSGYNSSAEAFRLADGLELGCDYRVVTVNDIHYVVYTIGRTNGRGMDTTMLALSRLVLDGEGYGQNEGKAEGSFGDGLGLVNPLDWEEYTDPEGKKHQVVKAPNDRSETPYILVDLKKNESGQLVDDGTGDLEFDVKAIGNTIRVAWVSYAEPVPEPADDARTMLRNAARNTVVRQAAFDVTDKNGFTEAVNLSDPKGGAAVYLPRIVSGRYTAYVRAGSVDEAARAALVAEYAEKLNGMGYYADRGSEASRSIFRYRLETYENNLDYKGDRSTLCIFADKGGERRTFEFSTRGGSDNGYASSEPIAPIDKLAVFETANTGGSAELYAAYTTWREDLDAAGGLQSISGLSLASFTDPGGPEGEIRCPYGHLQVRSESLDEHAQIDTLFVYEGKASGAAVPASESLLFTGQDGKILMISADRISGSLKAKGAGSGELLERTAFSGGEAVDRTGFVFGADGDGNIVAVYIGSVANTTNTGLYISVFDRRTNAWGGGTLLAMRRMDVYEDSAKYGWTDEEAGQAYLGELPGYSDGVGAGRGGMDQFQFANPQIALGVKSVRDDTLPAGEETDLTRSNTTLTILTQGMMRYLAYEEADGQRFLISGAKPPADAAFKEGMGVYAISYGIGRQSIGQVSLSFVEDQFTAGAQLTANLSFMNTGDAGIRGSADHPVTVTLSVDGEELPAARLAAWTVTDNIYPGRKVELSGEFTLPVTLPENAGFCLNVSEDEAYAEEPYAAAVRDIYIVKKLPELDFVEADIRLCEKDNGELRLDADGNVLVDVDLLAGNRSIEDARDVYLQFSYGIYDPNLASLVKLPGEETAAWHDVIYMPLDISGHNLTVGEEEPLPSTLAGSGDETARGILRLGDIRSGYGRRIRGTITVPPDAFAIFGKDRTREAAGSLKLKAELFSGGGEAAADGAGLAEHEEYNGYNNAYEAAIEHKTAFIVPRHLEVPVGTKLRLPVFFSTTLGNKEPEISAVELMDREVGGGAAADTLQRTDLLAWQQSTFRNGQGMGTLVLRGARTGISYLRILDGKTNAYKDIAVSFTAAESGLDITNDNGIFTYFDTEGRQDTGNDRAWTFQEHIETWRNNEKPFNGTLALGRTGASFLFTTEAERIALNFQGEITVSGDFPGFRPLTLKDEGQMRLISFGANPENLPHTVKVTVTKAATSGKDDCAYFDRMIEYYSGDQVLLGNMHPDDHVDQTSWKNAQGFGFFWEGGFPKKNSLRKEQVFDTTLYGVVNGLLQRDAKDCITCAGDNVKILSLETAQWGSYGERFKMKVRFTGNGLTSFMLENDKHEKYEYSVDVDWWSPGTSAFYWLGDSIFEAYIMKYPSLADSIPTGGEVLSGSEMPVDDKWMHAEADERGGMIRVHIDDDAPAENFEVCAADYAEYLETNRFPQAKTSVIIGRGETVLMPVPEDCVMLVRAEDVKNVGENSEYDFEIIRNDGTVERFRVEEPYYHNSELVDVPGQEDTIGFRTQSLVLSGRIGVNFFMNLPEIEGIDYRESFMEFTVCGKKTVVPFDENARNRPGTFYRFTSYVNSIQMADKIKAVFHYFKNGEEKTVQKTYSVRQYIADFDAKGDDPDQAAELIHALADYGHYAQPYLSGIRGWRIGADHLAMDRYYKESYSEKELAAARDELGRWGFSLRKAADVSGVTCSLRLDSGTDIFLYVTMAKGYSGEISASVNDSPCEVLRLKDGRFRIRIPDISAHRLGENFRVKLTTGAGTTETELSALAYVRDALGGPLNKDEENAMLSLFRYFAEAVKYLKNAAAAQ